jgi:N-acetylmuramoyl-L-alanine amidase
LKLFPLLKKLKSAGTDLPVPAPGIMTTLLLATIPLLALTVVPGSNVLSPDLTQDTVRRAEADATGNNTPTQLRTVVIDAGHGGKDPGCIGRRTRESWVVLKLALQLGRKIKQELPKVRVIYTRSSDHFVELAERSAIANRNRADLFISLHCNASPSSSRVYGTETYTMGLHKTEGNLDVAKRENAVILKEDNYQQTYKGFNPNSPLAHIMLANYQHAFMGSSINFAEKVERSFRRNAERTSRGVKQAGFLVLWRTTMPSVLIETGYLTNPTEEAYLMSQEGQVQITEAIYKAFEQYKEEIDSAG